MVTYEPVTPREQPAPAASEFAPYTGCEGITRRGMPCRFPARKGTNFGINHEPGAHTREAASRAGTAAAEAREDQRQETAELLRAVISFNDRASIQAVLDTVTRLSLAGRIPRSTAHIVLRACSIATHNFDAPRDTLTGIEPQQHERFSYFDRVNGLLHTIDPLLEEAADRE
jgi:hypothetical protein